MALSFMHGLARGSMPLLPFLQDAGRLKRTKRTGWLLDGVRDGESVAEHSWRCALMALVLRSPGVDPHKLCAMLLLHDLAEARTGDLVTDDKEQYHTAAVRQHSRRRRYRLVLLEEKRRREAAALEAMLKPLGPRAKPLRALLKEYNARRTPTARLAKDIDILELAIQAVEYEHAQGKRLDHYFHYARSAVRTPVGKRLLDEILATRRRRSSRSPRASS